MSAIIPDQVPPVTTPVDPEVLATASGGLDQRPSARKTENCSLDHAWIQGALESGIRAAETIHEAAAAIE